VNYTREPIIETVITPKEGCKLIVRNSKMANKEEYFVESLEVVTFGNAIFFRSTERPKSFLVPVTDFEIIELKETKMVLKTANIERSIKIGGGKTEDTKSQKRKRRQKPYQEKPKLEKSPQAQMPVEKGGDKDDETQVSSSILRKLFPPPPNLIKEKLNHIKSPEKVNESISKEIVKEETPKEEKKTEEIKEETQKPQEIKKEAKSEPKEEAKKDEPLVVEETIEKIKEEISPEDEKKDK